MSNTIRLNFHGEREGGVRLREWEAFCVTHKIRFSPQTIGWNTYYAYQVEVEIWFGPEGTGPARDSEGALRFDTVRPPDRAFDITFRTSYGAMAMDDLAHLARLAWLEFGGTVHADPAMRPYFLGIDE